MKILIISANFFPILGPRAHRATELAIELAKQGHEVSSLSLCGNYNYEDFKSRNNIRILSLSNSKLGLLHNDNTRNYTIPIKILNKILGNKLDLPYFELYFLVLNYLKQHNETYNLVISLAHPHPIHWGVAKYLDLNPAFTEKWIADCGDPYMLNPILKRPKMFKKKEEYFCDKAYAITIPYEGAINGYYREYHSKIKIIPQGFNIDEVLLVDYVENKIPTFAYSGVFYKGHRDPTNFLNFLTTLDYEFKFIIYTKSTVLLGSFAEKLGEKLEIRNYVPREILLKELSKMDFLINIKNESDVQSPSKLIDYALTRRPILNISSKFSEMSNFNKFVKGDYSYQVKVPNLQDYNIKNIAAKFLSI